MSSCSLETNKKHQKEFYVKSLCGFNYEQDEVSHHGKFRSVYVCVHTRIGSVHVTVYMKVSNHICLFKMCKSYSRIK